MTTSNRYTNILLCFIFYFIFKYSDCSSLSITFLWNVKWTQLQHRYIPLYNCIMLFIVVIIIPYDVVAHIPKKILLILLQLLQLLHTTIIYYCYYYRNTTAYYYSNAATATTTATTTTTTTTTRYLSGQTVGLVLARSLDFLLSWDHFFSLMPPLIQVILMLPGSRPYFTIRTHGLKLLMY